MTDLTGVTIRFAGRGPARSRLLHPGGSAPVVVAVTHPRQLHSLNEPRHVFHAGWDKVRWFREHALEGEAVQER